MSITTRSEYGLRAMVLLAEQLGDERLSAGEIARREDIPVKYLEQLLAELKRAGLVESRAGARGGYRLSRPAREICVQDVVLVLDGPVTATPCASLERGSEGEIPSVGERLRPLWIRLQQAMEAVLQQTTLDQLRFGTRLVAPLRPSPTATDLTQNADDSDESADSPMYHI